jgi:hypothetical protein
MNIFIYFSSTFELKHFGKILIFFPEWPECFASGSQGRPRRRSEGALDARRQNRRSHQERQHRPTHRLTRWTGWPIY